MTKPCIHGSVEKKVRAFCAWMGALLFLVHLYSPEAQNNVSFEASISAKEVVAGTPFELSFTLLNAEGLRFSPPKFTNFRTGGISEMRGMSYVNKRSSTSQTWTLELTALKPGIFSIGAATVVADGKTLSTKPLTVNVLAAASNQSNINLPPGTNEQIFVAAEFDRKEAYVGQQITWRIRLYTQLSVEGYDIIALPDFKGFFTKEKVRYDKRVEYLNIRRKKYAVRTLHEEAVFPQETGALKIDAARVSVGIEQPGAQGFLFGPKPVSLQTQPVVLNVKLLPQPAPNEFTGGVGAYDWEVKTDTSVLSTDDALSIVVEIKGNGDTRRFAAPKIIAPPNCEIFEPRILEEEEYEGENEILHRKRFEYILLPKDTGEMNINPALSYFDPDSNGYRQLNSSPIRFRVTAGKNYQSPNSLSDLPDNAPVVIQKPGFSELFLQWMGSPLFWTLLSLPFFAFGIYLLLRKRNPAVPTAVVVQQNPVPPIPVQPRPLPNATVAAAQQLAFVGSLLKQGDPHRFYGELFKALQLWLSDRFGLLPAQMNEADISNLLMQRGASAIRIQAFRSVWHSCEQSIYGGQAQTDQMEYTWQMARQVLDALEKETR